MNNQHTIPGLAKSRSLLTAMLVVAAATSGNSQLWGENKAPPAVSFKAQPFPLADVRLLDGPFRQNMERDRRYLHALESDRLLHMFRANAGLPAPAKPYGGWELREVRGHTMGHYLSAAALMVASTGDARLKAKASAIVAELAKCQAALGDSGYLSAFPESFIERAEQQQPVWAPYYTLHKLMAGLLDMYLYSGNQQALDVVEGMARWCKSRCEKLTDAQMQAMLNHTEQGGMNEVLANLYGVTGNQDYLQLSRRFVQRTYNDPLAAGHDELKGQHVNSFIPNMIGTARQYELSGNRSDHDVARFFWHQVVEHRSYATGGTSNREHWQTDPDQLARELGDHTQETCCTYNMLKLTRHLFCWEANSRYADYYERALFNSILSTQDPRTGMMMYFVPLAPGRWKYFNTPTDSFWCCTGTGLENHARYGESIYFHDDEGLFVNLFIASELNWRERGVRVRQETRFPEQPNTSLTIQTVRDTEFTLRLRVPGWAQSGISVRLNGKPLEVPAQPAGYFAIRRTWSNGDRVAVNMPMSLRAEPMPDDPTVVAYMYGPLVLAGKLGSEGLTDEMVYTTQNWYPFPRDQIAAAPDLVADSADLTTCLERVPDSPLTFRTVGLTHNITLVPYYRLFGERYAIYWRVYRRGSSAHQQALAEQQARRELAARTVDQVRIGDPQSESAHGFAGEHTQAGVHLGRAWRHATDGGQFSYRLAVPEKTPVVLNVTYWGSDRGARTFDIIIDGRKIATQTLDNDRPGKFFDVQYPIPRDLINGKQAVTVRFQAHPKHMAGGVFGCRVLRGRPTTRPRRAGEE